MQLGAFEEKISRLNKAKRSYYAKVKISPKKTLKEFRVDADCLLQSGDVLCVSHFLKGQRIDVSAQSIGKGFAGAMKRHNFSGLRATHGVSVFP